MDPWNTGQGVERKDRSCIPVRRFFRWLISSHLLLLTLTLAAGLTYLGIRLQITLDNANINGTPAERGLLSVNATANVLLNNQQSNLVHFVQLSDSHISQHDESRLDNFNSFVKNHLPHISPDFVIHSGDITDGKPLNGLMYGLPFDDEFSPYNTILNETGWLQSGRWFDMPGNHDFSQVIDVDDLRFNLFRKYSANPKEFNDNLANHRAAHYDVVRGGRTYRVLFLEELPHPSLTHPLKLLADFSKSMSSRLNSVVDELGPADVTVLVGHYPIATIRGASMEKFMSDNNVVAYLCGHWHLPNLYMRVGKNLELELNDMKESKGYRVGAIDDDLFSFVDTNLDDWPLIIPTNPKNAQFLSAREPYERMKSSSHIRVLVFSNATVTNVKVSINSEILCASMNQAPDNPNLYVCPWNPSFYPAGLHTLTIEASDSNNVLKTHTEKFSLDGTIVPMPSSQWNVIQRMNMLATLIMIVIVFWTVLFPLSLYLSSYVLYQARLGGPVKSTLDENISPYVVTSKPNAAKGLYQSEWERYVGALFDSKAAWFAEDETDYVFDLEYSHWTYLTWQCHTWLWRFSMIPRRLRRPLLFYGICYLIFPIILGPCVGVGKNDTQGIAIGEFGAAWVFGLVWDADFHFLPSFTLLVAAASLTLWTTPLVLFVSLISYRKAPTKLVTRFKHQPISGPLGSVEGIFLLSWFGIASAGCMFFSFEAFGIITTLISPIAFPHYVFSWWLVARTIRYDMRTYSAAYRNAFMEDADDFVDPDYLSPVTAV